jgi:type I restriction enzyme M protein
MLLKSKDIQSAVKDFDFKAQLMQMGNISKEDFEKSFEILREATASYQALVKRLAPDGFEVSLKNTEIDKLNEGQHTLRMVWKNFEEMLQEQKKELEKTYKLGEKLYQWALENTSIKEVKIWKDTANAVKAFRNAMDELAEHLNEHQTKEPKSIDKSTIYFITQATWLQERFPQAEYEDITGLCKSATIAEIEEQDYSLNPGRYVGVVIEEDGMTEEEFMNVLLSSNEKLNKLNEKSDELSELISQNLTALLR